VSHPEGSNNPVVLVAPGRRRPPRLAAGLIVTIVGGSFVLARLTPGSEPAEPVVTLQTRAAETPVAAIRPASALPKQEWYTGPAAPLADLLIEDGSIRWLRLGGAGLTSDPLSQPGDDLLLPGIWGSTVCLCWQPSGTEAGDPRSLQLIRRDSDLTERSRSTVLRLRGLDLARRPNGPTQIALEPSPDGQYVYMARAIRSPTQWQVNLSVIDLATATVVDSKDLIAGPRVDRSRVRIVEPPVLRIAPDGRHALVSSGVGRATTSGPAPIARQAWIIEFDGAMIGSAKSADAVSQPLPAPSGRPCSWIAFATASIIAAGCGDPTSESGTAFRIVRFDLSGRDLGPPAQDVPFVGQDPPLLDVGRGIAYSWDPVSHSLLAVDLVNGGSRRSTLAPFARDNAAEIVREGARPAQRPSTTWTDGQSTTAPAEPRTLVGSPDGTLLFAIGSGSRLSGSSGIWVFDARTLSVLEHWPALAAYESITTFEDGRWLAAAGRPGMTASGGPADWGASVTIHDTDTGRPVLRLGDIGTSESVAFPRSGMLVTPPVTTP
jgi:hypothetical protein